MKSVILMTGNPRKIGEAKLACEPMGIQIEPKSVHVDEIQSTEPIDISIDKAKRAFELLKAPLVVTDTFFSIPALSGFPGAYMKDVAEWFESSDFLNLMKDKNDRSLLMSENITYIDSSGLKTFTKGFKGIIVDGPRGTGNSIENIAEFGGFTLGERRQQGGYSHKPDDYVWVDFARWYLEQPEN